VLLDQVARIFAACGMREADARLVADTLVKADLRGIHSHGTLRVPDYIKKLTEDGVEPQAAPRIQRQIGGAIVVDGATPWGRSR
jgi:LDH2 family malate/lactate/ureidoglycolate dehydrogenase